MIQTVGWTKVDEVLLLGHAGMIKAQNMCKSYQMVNPDKTFKVMSGYGTYFIMMME